MTNAEIAAVLNRVASSVAAADSAWFEIEQSPEDRAKCNGWEISQAFNDLTDAIGRGFSKVDT